MFRHNPVQLLFFYQPLVEYKLFNLTLLTPIKKSLLNILFWFVVIENWTTDYFVRFAVSDKTQLTAIRDIKIGILCDTFKCFVCGKQ
jgi:hypothetical protein